MRHGSLFSGIGGFDLAAEWMGWENVFHCEWNEFGQKVLHHYWPEAELFSDITKSNFTKYANTIDVLSGGFPCQPYSSAGKRLGKEDSRHLWPSMLRAIREIQPSWVVGENVRGLTNWNGGVVFDEVQADLEAEGYEVTPFLLPAAGVGAPHRRDRIWFVAYSKSNGSTISKLGESESRQQLQTRSNINGFEGLGDVANTSSSRQQTNNIMRKSKESEFTTGIVSENISSNSNGNGFNERNGNNEINASERGINALGDINESNGNGDVADTNGSRQQKFNKCIRSERERIFENLQTNVATNTTGIRGNKNDWRGNREPNVVDQISETRYVADTESKGQFGLYETRQKNIINGENTKLRGSFTGYNKENNWQHFPTVSPICNGDDGLSDRLDNITFPKWRNESIKAGGNAVVPQVVHQIFKAIELYERSRTPNKD